MKRISLLLIAVTLFTFAGLVLAKDHKSSILHCGCFYDGAVGAGMAYVEISVSKKTRGHDGHVAGSIDACFTGTELVDGVLVDTYADYVRNGDDCQLDGPPLGDPIGQCDELDEPPAAGDACGVEVLD